MGPKSMHVQRQIYYETNEAKASVTVIQEIPETIILKWVNFSAKSMEIF